MRVAPRLLVLANVLLQLVSTFEMDEKVLDSQTKLGKLVLGEPEDSQATSSIVIGMVGEEATTSSVESIHVDTLLPWLATRTTSATVAESSLVSEEISTLRTFQEPEGLPLHPRLSPSLGVGGALLVITGLAYLAIGIKHARLQIFISAAYLSSLATVILVIYLTDLPMTDAILGAYLVAVVMAGLLAGAAAIFFEELTEGLACLLGGFCLSMWLLTLQSGGLIKSASGKVAFISVLSLAAFSTSMSRYTRRHSLMVMTAFGGATAVVLGIDCFTRQGLKEFWVWIWHINEDLFSLGSTTYPLSTGMKVETVIIVIIALLGIVSQAEIWRIIQEQRKCRFEKRQVRGQRYAEDVRQHGPTRATRLARNVLVKFGPTRDFGVVDRQYRPEAYSLMVTGLSLGESNFQTSKVKSQTPTLVELDRGHRSIPDEMDTEEAHARLSMSIRVAASLSKEPSINGENVAEICRQTSTAEKASGPVDATGLLCEEISEETLAQSKSDASEENGADIDREASKFHATHRHSLDDQKRLSEVQAIARSSGCSLMLENPDELLDDGLGSAAATLDEHDLWNGLERVSALDQRVSSSTSVSSYESRRRIVFSTMHDDFGSTIEECFRSSTRSVEECFVSDTRSIQESLVSNPRSIKESLVNPRSVDQLTRFSTTSLTGSLIPDDELLDSAQRYNLKINTLPSQLSRVALRYRIQEWAKHISMADTPPAEHDEAFLQMLDGGTEAAVPVDMVALDLPAPLRMAASEASTLVPSATAPKDHFPAQEGLDAYNSRDEIANSLRDESPNSLRDETANRLRNEAGVATDRLPCRSSISSRVIIAQTLISPARTRPSSRCPLAHPAFYAPSLNRRDIVQSRASLLDRRDFLLQSRASCYHDGPAPAASRWPASPSGQHRPVTNISKAQMDLKLAGFRASIQEDLQRVEAVRSWGEKTNVAMTDRHRQAMRRLQSQVG